ncbi:MAG TPA: TolC family protein [Candidatus Rifleibacterium sp.]|nr:TolC family protein [Candidatus Rifleibacterium sp.]HPT46120.1 TolC family protein [Candidatus Rifleibacterium sp.]
MIRLPFKTLGLVLMILMFAAGLSAREIRVGVVADGLTDNTRTLLNAMDAEIKKLVPDTDQVIFAESMVKNGNWQVESIKAAIDELLKSSDVDAVLTLGPIASHLVAHYEKLAKPVFAAHIINAAMQGLSRKNGSSGIENLAYIDLGIDLGRHIERFQEIRNFKRLHLLVSPSMMKGIPDLAAHLAVQAKARNVELVVVPAVSNLSEVAAQLTDAEAVYLAPLLDMPSEQQSLLIGKINALKIPSMAMLGRAPVESGVLSSIAMEIDTQKLARRIALNFQRLLMGDNPADYQVDFSHTERLTINMQTAREIGVFPTWEQMTDAALINDDSGAGAQQLSITRVIETALLRNLQLVAKKQETAAGAQTVKRAESAFEPKLSVFGRQTVIDEDRAESMLTPARYTTQLGADLLFVLYSEQARANIDVQKLFQNARREEERALMLDIIRDASTAYLNVLKTRTLQNIQRDNLEVTRANLEIARFREQVGTSGPAEVYRWEIQMAGARQAVVDASAMCKKAELALNQLLNAAQEEEFSTADPDIFSQVFFLDFQRIAPYIDNQSGYKVFRDFLVADTYAFSPEIQQIGRGIEAMARSRRSAQKRNSQPVVALQGNFSRTVRESGIGADKPSLPAPFKSVFSFPDKNDWHVALNISLPIFEGGDREAAIKEAEARLKKLEADRGYLMQRLELNTRASLEDARASFSSIGLSQTRAEFAAKTLDLVQSAYSRGAVNILDLIDAQNAFLVAKEASANAVFSFLSDFIKVCRAVGTFDFILNPESNSHWYERLELFYASSDNPPVFERRPPARKVLNTASSTETLLYED